MVCRIPHRTRILALLLIAAAVGRAETNAVDAAASEAELRTARAALRDGLWDVARLHAAKASGTAAKLVVLESYACENRWEDVRKALADWNVAEAEPAFDYYRAAVKGDFARAADALRKGGSAAGVPEARMLEAEMLVRNRDVKGAEKLWREVISMTNAGARAFAVAAANLGDVAALRKAYAGATPPALRRMVALRLGVALVKDEATAAEGDRLVRSVVRDSPDVEGACAAFVSLASAAAKARRWKDAADTYRDAVEIWPEAAKMAEVQEGRGEVQAKLGQFEDALQSFASAETLATDDELKALAVMRQGDVLSETGRGDEAMAKYRAVIARFPGAACVPRLKQLVAVRELENKGLEAYRAFRFADAQKAFEQVAAADESRKARMAYFSVLCLYGQGADEDARKKAKGLAETCPDTAVRADAALWLAKFAYNRGEWRESGALFAAYAEANPTAAYAAEALLWATRAAFAESDLNLTIQTATRLAETYPASPAVPQALLVQSEALLELARFDAAVLVLERVASADGVGAADRTKAALLKADALFAMGADNPTRYQAALEAYRAVSFGSELSASQRLVLSAKVGRTLERLKRREEAVDQYYTQVVLAYRDGRFRGEPFDDDARAAFSRAAFRLVDEYESRGKDFQALKILELVSSSDVPAAEEAEKRIDRLTTKGRFL